MTTTVYAVRAVMVDGATIDLLLFFDATDAQKHAEYVRAHCGLLGYDELTVVRRRVIGVQEPLDRRTRLQIESGPRRRRTD